MPPPHLLASLVPESKMFKDLIEMEQRLDWTMLRKRAEVNDALGRVVKVSQQQRRIRTWLDQDELICILSFGSQIKRTLRVYLSNTARNQEWQRGELRVPRACP
jgi:SWI/SNF-related matrix-associated actin-dependent regulator of chromatin subfamily D